MGIALLKEVLANWTSYELDDSIYLPTTAEPDLDTSVMILPFDPKRKRVFEGQYYFLGIEQVRDVIEGLEGQLGRSASPVERMRAAIHYAKYDSFIDPLTAIRGE